MSAPMPIAGSLLTYEATNVKAIHKDVMQQIREFENSLPDGMVVSASYNGCVIIVEQIEFKDSGLVALKGHCIESKLPARILCHLHQLHLALIGLENPNTQVETRQPVGFVLPNGESA